MDEYVSLPAQRLAHLVRKYMHHTRMRAIEDEHPTQLRTFVVGWEKPCYSERFIDVDHMESAFRPRTESTRF